MTLKLEVRFENLPFKLITPTRVYIHQGSLVEVTNSTEEQKKDSYFILFNNALISARTRGNKKLKVKKKKKIFRFFFFLNPKIFSTKKFSFLNVKNLFFSHFFFFFFC